MEFYKKLFGLCLLTLSFASHAAIINYDEAVSGDLSLDDFWFDTVGTQTIRGTGSASVINGAFAQDGDLFDFNLVAGLEVTNINFAASLVASSNVASASVRGSVSNSGQTRYLDTAQILNTQGSWPDVDSLPLGNASSLYRAGSGLNISRLDAQSDYTISYNWEFTFDVAQAGAAAQVSEPAPFTLLGLGLVALAVVRRKQ